MKRRLHGKLLIGVLVLMSLFIGWRQTAAEQVNVIEQPPDFSEEALFLAKGSDWTFGIPPNPKDFWATVRIVNNNSKPAIVIVDTFDAAGNFLGTAETLEIAGGKIASVSTVNIDGTIPVTTTKIRLTSDEAISASEVVGAMKGNWSTVLNGVLDEEDNHSRWQATASAKASGCCGYSSSDNPYPCCGSLGNCTWWAWKQAKDEWSKKIPKWGDAKSWARNARASGYPVKSTPKKDTIGVNTWVAGTGHVVWVKSVSGSTVSVTEMNWCSSCKKEKTYPKSWFDGGYIYKK